MAAVCESRKRDSAPNVGIPPIPKTPGLSTDERFLPERNLPPSNRASPYPMGLWKCSPQTIWALVGPYQELSAVWTSRLLPSDTAFYICDGLTVSSWLEFQQDSLFPGHHHIFSLFNSTRHTGKRCSHTSRLNASGQTSATSLYHM